MSVIVPAWNEEARLSACLRSVGAPCAGLEIILADGGSTDRTAGVAREQGAQVVESPVRQRAAQLNLGVQRAQGDVVLFLHADTILPTGWRERVCAALDADPAVIGGAFRRRFDHPSRWLRCTCALADIRGRFAGIFLGDQAMFVRTAAFWALGGFHPLDSCEDLDLSLRLARAGRTCLLAPPVLSSGRRFQRRGSFLQTWLDLWTAGRFIARRPPDGGLTVVEAGRPAPAGRKAATVF